MVTKHLLRQVTYYLGKAGLLCGKLAELRVKGLAQNVAKVICRFSVIRTFTLIISVHPGVYTGSFELMWKP